MPDAPLPPLPPFGVAPWRLRAQAWADRWLPATWPPATVAALAGGAAGLVALAVAAAALAGVGRSSPPPAPAAVPAPGVDVAAGGGAGEGGGEVVVVDVAGAVARPGLVRLPSGARVADALAAAGGPGPDADLAAVNQARPVGDGEQVRVPRVGEAPPAGAGGDGGAAVAAGPTDLNVASAEDLDRLPGVGPATAAAIVEHRRRHGRFRAVDQLLDVPGIGPTRLERLRPLVRVAP